MPHLTLEYTRNLPDFIPERALAVINQTMYGSGLFSEADIKSRALALDVFQTGISDQARGFIHITVKLLSGRSDRERKALSEALLSTILTTVDRAQPIDIQFSVETVDIDRPSYAKTITHATP